MSIEGIHHVQIAMPAGREDEARAFYSRLFGIPEVPKPDSGKLGGVWFESGPLRVHLGVEQDFRPARKAHPCFLVRDLKQLVGVLRAEGFQVDEAPLADYYRVYVADPFQNRIELMEVSPA